MFARVEEKGQTGRRGKGQHVDEVDTEAQASVMVRVNTEKR